MQYDIDIDNAISDWYCSKQYVKQRLASCKSSAVSVRINSPGGLVSHGLDIAQQFRDHGNVTAYIFGMTASAATIVAMGCKKIIMSKYAFMLIHRCSMWIDEWGSMNEEQVKEAIKRLENTAENQQRIDLTLAQLYSEKSGKSIKEVHDLMTQEKWLTAQEAKEFGLIDEIIEEGKKPSISNKMAEQFAAMGGKLPESVVVTQEDKNFMEMISDGFSEIKNLFKSSNKTSNNLNKTEMNKTFTCLMALLSVDGFEATDGKITLTEEQVKAINDEMQRLNDTSAANEQTINERDQTIATLQEQVENLKKMPGAEDERKHDETTDTEDKDAEAYAFARKLYDNL